MEAKKIIQGERYTDENGKQWVWMGNTAWAIIKEGRAIDFYQSKIAASARIAYLENK